jgi:hypothetical protein
MEIHDFGDTAAVMISQHFPTGAASPTAMSGPGCCAPAAGNSPSVCKSTIQSANPPPAVTAKQQ